MTQTQTDGAAEESLFRGYPSRLFFGVSIGWALVVFGRQLLPPLVPTIIADLGITSFEAGVAITVLWGTRALSQYPGGRFADDLSRKTVIVGGLVILVVGFAVLSTSVLYPMFIMGAAIVGVGSGAFSVSTRTTVADLYVKKRGRAFGIQTAFNSLAGIGSAGGAILILSIGTWRSAFFPVAAALAVIAVILHFTHRDGYLLRWVNLEIVTTAGRLYKKKRLRLAIGTYVMIYFAWQGMITFLPAFLQAERGFSTAMASAGFGLIFVIGAVAGPVAGAFADRLGKIKTGVGIVLVCFLGLLALLLAESFWMILASIVVLAIGFRAFFPVMQAYLLDTFADASMAGDLGAAKAVWGGVGSLGPAYTGMVAGQWSYAAAFAGLLGCLLLSLLTLVIVSEM